MVVTLGQQCNVGEKPTVILYTYINRDAGTLDKKQKQKQKQCSSSSTTSNMVVIIYCFIGYKDQQNKASTWYLNGFPDGSNLVPTVQCRGEAHRYTIHFLY